MKVGIEEGRMYINNVRLCLVEAGNGSADIPYGLYEVSSQFSHSHGRVLPNAAGLGWLGAEPSCDVILGNVRGSDGVIPCEAAITALLARLEIAEGVGKRVTLEVK